MLNLSKRALQTYRASGKIPFSMLGGKVYFKSEDIVAMLKAGFQHRQTSQINKR